MNDFRNCKKCPHRNISPEIKQIFYVAGGIPIFENCIQNEVSENILCFFQAVNIDWEKFYNDNKIQILQHFQREIPLIVND